MINSKSKVKVKKYIFTNIGASAKMLAIWPIFSTWPLSICKKFDNNYNFNLLVVVRLYLNLQSFWISTQWKSANVLAT